MSIRHRAVVVGLAAALAMGGIVPVAYADPQSELAEAANRLETLGGELATLEDDLAEKTTSLEDTSYKIGEKQAQIGKTQEELVVARAVLGGRMRSSYKSGASTLLGVFLGAESLDDIIARIYYMDKIASNDAQAIDAVKKLEEQLDKEKADLEKTKAEQEKAVSDLQTRVDEYSTKVAEAQSYYDSLDAQVQAQLEAEENARVQAALEAAAREQEQQQAQAAAEAQQPAATETQQETVQETETEEVVETVDDTEEETSSSSSSSSGGSKVVAGYGGLGTAYAAIGCPYVYGAAGPSSFDCSGLVCYCYGWSRGRTTYDMISSLQSDGRWKTSMCELSVGDLVFPSAGHVGIYIGGGQMIHAPTPGRSVCIADVYAFYGGGPF